MDAITAMEVAIKPFDKYIDDLAKGELDGYFGSIQHQGKEPDLDFGLPSGPILLLDGLGGELSQKDQERVNDLFSPGITFVTRIANVQECFLILLLIAIYLLCLGQAKPVSLWRAFAKIGVFIFHAAPSWVGHLAQVISRRRVECLLL